jgi:hypothetical protein
LACGTFWSFFRGFLRFFAICALSALLRGS